VNLKNQISRYYGSYFKSEKKNLPKAKLTWVDAILLQRQSQQNLN